MMLYKINYKSLLKNDVRTLLQYNDDPENAPRNLARCGLNYLNYL